MTTVSYGRNITTNPPGDGVSVDGLTIQSGGVGPSGVRAQFIQNTEVGATAPTTGQVLQYGGSTWAPEDPLVVLNDVTADSLYYPLLTDTTGSTARPVQLSSANLIFSIVGATNTLIIEDTLQICSDPLQLPSAPSTAICIGNGSFASASCVSVGNTADSRGSECVAIGTNARTNSRSRNTSVGVNAVCGFLDNSTAIGHSASVGSNATAVGYSSTAGTSSAALGVGASAPGGSCTAVGASAACVFLDFATAVGASAVAGSGATSLGYASSASGGGTALGRGAVCGGNANVAVGVGATCNFLDNAVAVGSASVAGSGCTSVGRGATTFSNSSVAVGIGALASGGPSVAVGPSASATGDNNLSFGSGAASSSVSMAFGNSSVAANNAIAFGRSASATGTNSIALGYSNNCSGFGSILVGAGSSSTIADSIGIGRNITISSTSRALGLNLNSASIISGLVPHIQCIVNGTDREIPIAARQEYLAEALAATPKTLDNTIARRYNITSAVASQTVLLPDVTTLLDGFIIRISNRSAQSVIVATSTGAATVDTLLPNTYSEFICLDAAGTNVATDWSQEDTGNIV